MTSNWKAETLMDIPVLVPGNEVTVQAIAPVRKFRIGWLVPCAAVAAAIIAYYAYGEFAELNAYLDGLTQYMESPAL